MEQAASMLGGLVGPAIGGLLADMAGNRAPFMLTGIAALLAALYGFLRLPETKKEKTEDSSSPSPSEELRPALAEVLSSSLLPLLHLTVFISLLSFSLSPPLYLPVSLSETSAPRLQRSFLSTPPSFYFFVPLSSLSPPPICSCLVCGDGDGEGQGMGR